MRSKKWRSSPSVPTVNHWIRAPHRAAIQQLQVVLLPARLRVAILPPVALLRLRVLVLLLVVTRQPERLQAAIHHKVVVNRTSWR